MRSLGRRSLPRLTFRPLPILGCMGERMLEKVGEVARRTGSSPWTIRRLAKEGLLPSIRFGPHGHLRFKPEDVDEFLERHRKVAA